MFNEKEKAIKLLQNGVLDKSKNNFHKNFVVLSKFFKYLGYNKEKSKEMIINWLEKQCCKEVFDNVMIDMNTVINDIYKKNYKFIDNINIPITENEILEIRKLRSRGDKVVGFALIYLSKLFGNSFYCYHNTLHKLTGISIRQIRRIINRLYDNEFIDIIQRDQTKKVIEKNNESVKRYSFPNRYRVLVKPCDNVIYYIGDIDNIVSDFEKCLTINN